MSHLTLPSAPPGLGPVQHDKDEGLGRYYLVMLMGGCLVALKNPSDVFHNLMMLNPRDFISFL